MKEIFKHFHFYDNCTLPENFRPGNRPSRKHGYQLVWKAPKDGVGELQAIFFYFRTIKTWNESPNDIVHGKSIDSFKNKLDEAWKDLLINFYEQERFIEAYIYLRICNSWLIIIIIIIITILIMIIIIIYKQYLLSWQLIVSKLKQKHPITTTICAFFSLFHFCPDDFLKKGSPLLPSFPNLPHFHSLPLKKEGDWQQQCVYLATKSKK